MKILKRMLPLLLLCAIPSHAQTPTTIRINARPGVNVLWNNVPFTTPGVDWRIFFPSNATMVNFQLTAETSAFNNYQIQFSTLPFDESNPSSGAGNNGPWLCSKTVNSGIAPTTTNLYAGQNLAFLFPDNYNCPTPQNGVLEIQLTGGNSGTISVFMTVFTAPQPALSPTMISGATGIPFPVNPAGGITGIGSVANGFDAVPNGNVQNSLNGNSGLSAITLLFNGTTWDRPVKCPNTTQIAVGAAATQTVVLGVAGQKVRICDLVVTASVAGTITMIEGTGALCVGGTTTIGGPFTLILGTPIKLGGSGTSVYQTNTVADGFCLTDSAAALVNGTISWEQH